MVTEHERTPPCADDAIVGGGFVLPLGENKLELPNDREDESVDLGPEGAQVGGEEGGQHVEPFLHDVGRGGAVGRLDVDGL